MDPRLTPEALLHFLRRQGIEVHDVARPPDSDELLVFLEAGLNQSAQAYALLDAHPAVTDVRFSPTTDTILRIH